MRLTTKWRRPFGWVILAGMLLTATQVDHVAAANARIKDLTTVEGVRTNALTGTGLVVGLDGTGGKGPITREMLLNFLQRSGLRADSITRANIRTDTQQPTDNMCAVTVTAHLPAFVRRGQKIDVVVSALDAESLQGGLLIDTPLMGVDGEIYAVASGAISLGGFSAKGQSASVKSNHPTRGQIVAGATVECEVPFKPGVGGAIRLLLRNADFITAHRIAKAINEKYPGTAQPVDAGTVEVLIPRKYRLSVVSFVGNIQALTVEPDVAARVVINENTGTIVAGHRVRIAKVAINHGNLTIVAAETPQVSQPAPLSQGVTAVTPQTNLEVTEERAPIAVLEPTTSVEDLARALNALEATPRDLASIFRQLHAAGALYGELSFQ